MRLERALSFPKILHFSRFLFAFICFDDSCVFDERSYINFFSLSFFSAQCLEVAMLGAIFLEIKVLLLLIIKPFLKTCKNNIH